jgi:hypothetical protein
MDRPCLVIASPAMVIKRYEFVFGGWFAVSLYRKPMACPWHVGIRRPFV